MARLAMALLLLACLLAPTTSAAGNTVAFSVNSLDKQSNSWSIHVPREGVVTFEVTVHSGAYTGMTFSGPGTCHAVALALGVPTTMTPPTVYEIDCGKVGLGWYTVSLSVGSGSADGALRSDGATILLA